MGLMQIQMLALSGITQERFPAFFMASWGVFGAQEENHAFALALRLHFGH